MTLIAFGSLKASPGVTTTVLAVAATWPGEARLVVECDPAGGDLAARFRLAETPGLVSLAAASRRDRGPELLWAHTQALPGGLPVVVGPAGADQARAALGVLTAPGAGLLIRSHQPEGSVVLADCGRVDPDSPAAPLLRAAHLVLLVARPRLSEVAHLAARIDALRATVAALGLVLVDDGFYPPREIAEALEVPVVGVLPKDPRGAAVLSNQVGHRRGVARLPLLRAAGDLAGRLAAATGAREAGQDLGPAADSTPGRRAPSGDEVLARLAVTRPRIPSEGVRS